MAETEFPAGIMFSYENQINKAQHRVLLQIVQLGHCGKTGLYEAAYKIWTVLRKGSVDILSITQAFSRKYS